VYVCPLFLMYRVELKGPSPAEVEPSETSFLMYRVELKDGRKGWGDRKEQEFLMYRVELKGYLVMGGA